MWFWKLTILVFCVLFAVSQAANACDSAKSYSYQKQIEVNKVEKFKNGQEKTSQKIEVEKAVNPGNPDKSQAGSNKRICLPPDCGA